MTRISGATMIVEEEPPRECSVCRQQRECRPYGPEGADICVDCIHSTPARAKEARRRFNERTAGVTDVIVPGSQN